MKTFKLFLVTFFALIVANGYSQQSNVNNVSGGTNSKGWSRISVSYIPSTLNVDGGDDLKFQGFNLGWTKGFNIANNVPLFIEAGAGIQFRRYSDSESESFNESGVSGKIKVTEKLNVLSLNIPVNLVYKFNATPDFSIEPFVGIDFRFNLMGKLKSEANYSGDYEDEVNEAIKDYLPDSDINIFDEDDMNDLGVDPAKRFQAGWHIGTNFTYKKVSLGISYGQDFNEIVEDCKLSTTTVTLGFNF